MDYKKILESHNKYGTTKDDILKQRGYDKLLKNVVIAPWWNVKMFLNDNYEVEQINDFLYNIKNGNNSFTFIQLKRMGASMLIDEIIRICFSDCENIIFVGSVGSLDKNINIGDLVIPKYSISGDGASRYLNDNLEDEFLKKEYSDEYLTQKLLDVTKKYAEKYNVGFHNVVNYSVDSIMCQFMYIDKILDMGASVIEMETAACFKAAKIMNKKISALFCVSDNTVTNKSLLSGRTNKEQEYRHNIRYKVIPKILFKVFEEL